LHKLRANKLQLMNCRANIDNKQWNNRIDINKQVQVQIWANKNEKPGTQMKWKMPRLNQRVNNATQKLIKCSGIINNK